VPDSLEVLLWQETAFNQAVEMRMPPVVTDVAFDLKQRYATGHASLPKCGRSELAEAYVQVVQQIGERFILGPDGQRQESDLLIADRFENVECNCL